MALVDVRGVPIAYEVHGTGSPVLLLSSFALSRARWEVGWLPALLDAGHQVITMDNRGVGESGSPPPPWTVADMAVDAAGLLDHLELAAVQVIGNSMGGWMTEELLVTRPDLVRAAVLLGSARPPTAYGRLTMEEMAAAVAAGQTLTVSRLMSLILTAAQLQDDAVVTAARERLDALLRGWPLVGQHGQLTATRGAMHDTEHVRRWSGINQPVLVVAYDQDVEVPPASAAAMARALPGGELVIVPGAGHGGPFTHVEASLAPVLPFLARAR